MMDQSLRFLFDFNLTIRNLEDHNHGGENSFEA